MKFPAAAIRSVPAPLNFSRTKPCPERRPVPQTGEGDVEVDSGLRGYERATLGKPASPTGELERAHLSGYHASEGHQPAAAYRGEVLEREVFTGQRAFSNVHRLLKESGLGGWRPRLVALRGGETGLEGHVRCLPHELARLPVDGLALLDLAYHLLHRVADDLVLQHPDLPYTRSPCRR